MTQLPEDIRFPEWMSIIRLMQSKARHQEGLAALTMTVLVNQDGKPLSWLPPVRTVFHPKSKSDEFLTFLELQNIIKRANFGD